MQELPLVLALMSSHCDSRHGRNAESRRTQRQTRLFFHALRQIVRVSVDRPKRNENSPICLVRGGETESNRGRERERGTRLSSVSNVEIKQRWEIRIENF